jgi:hypothetical protein
VPSDSTEVEKVSQALNESVTFTVVRREGGIEGPAPAGTALLAYANGTHVSSATTDGSSTTYTMSVPSGQTYQFRAMYLGISFWSETCTSATCASKKIVLADVQLTVVQKVGGQEVPAPAGTGIGVWPTTSTSSTQRLTG